MAWERLILASASPRRRELLGLLDEPFDVLTAETDERKIQRAVLESRGSRESFPALSARLAETLAHAKAEAVSETYGPGPRSLLLAADTLVVLDEEIFGKPKDEAEAEAMLCRLASRTHLVFTGVVMRLGEREERFCSVSEVRFYPLDERLRRLIRRYVKSGSPLDKAGGYGIQDMGGLLVESVKGDFYNIVGLPIAAVAEKLESFR